jgi:hypothetical protein
MEDSIQNQHNDDSLLISTHDRPLDPGNGIETPGSAEAAVPVVIGNAADVPASRQDANGELNQTGLPVHSQIHPEMDQLGSAEAPVPVADDNKDAQPLVTRLVSRETLSWVKPSGASAYAPQSDSAAAQSESVSQTVNDGGGDPAVPQSDGGTSDLLQLDAKTYPWLYANSTLEACFVNVEDGSQGTSFLKKIFG